MFQLGLLRWLRGKKKKKKNPPASAGDAGDLGLIFGSGTSPGEGNGNPLQHSCPKHPMDRGAWWATVHGVSKSKTQLSMHNNTWMGVSIIPQ